MENKKSFKSLKIEARNSLKGKWGLAIAVTMLSSIILWLPNILAGVYRIGRMIRLITEQKISFLDHSELQELKNSLEMSKISISSGIFVWIINIILVGAITYGVSRFFINLIRNNNAKIENLFEGFKILGKTILVNLVIFIFKFLWSLLGVIAIILFTVLSVFQAANRSDSEAMGIYIVFIIGIMAIGLALQIFLSRYALTYYIFSDDRELDIMGSINKSVELMKGNKIRLFLLYLSFIGWYVLGVVSCGIGFIWISPYVKATIAAFYDSLVASNNEEEQLEII